MTLQEKIDQLHQEGGFNTADNARLHIPGFIMSDGPHGVRDGMATAFPVGMAMAATWDPALTKEIGKAIGEKRIKDTLIYKRGSKLFENYG